MFFSHDQSVVLVSTVKKHHAYTNAHKPTALHIHPHVRVPSDSCQVRYQYTIVYRERVGGRVGGWVGEWVGRWVGGWVGGRVSGWTSVVEECRERKTNIVASRATVASLRSASTSRR